MRRVLTALATGLLISAVPIQNVHAEGWKNPMEVPGLKGRSLGDPYIFKYRGYYYMYVSAGDKNIYCWKTKDLINWSSAYICCTDETTAVAYAPEVIYWNGKFYMCTSPRGGGHYLLTSDSPTGPFTHQTGNLGRDIDGSMFVNDDGKWYFYHANNAGIHACNMPTHLTFGSDNNLGCCMTGQWTEGPCVFKRNNIYYLLYTGNHVWTNGYRIDYATSKTGPLTGFTPQSEQNPILIDAETPWHKALGHGTAFVGPDLDTYYFCYHNLQDNKSRRLLNYETIGWNGDKLMMTGPTDWEQDAPMLATTDYFERNEIGSDWDTTGGGDWQIVGKDYLEQKSTEGTATALFKTCAHDSYTAEFTMKAAAATESGTFGAIFSYKDAQNYSEVLINQKKLVYNSYVDGEVKVNKSSTLPTDFDPCTWHAIRVEKNDKKGTIYIDGMRKLSLTGLDATGGSIGYITHDATADFSYIAMSKYVGGSSIHDISIPVPGMMAASFYSESEGSNSQVSLALSAGTAYLQRCVEGTKLTYRINVQKDNVYNMGLRYRSSAISHVRLLVDGEVIRDNIELPSTRSTMNVLPVDDLPIPGGHHTLSIEVLDGTPFLYEYNIKKGVAEPHVMADNFDSGIGSEWGYREGNWTVVDGMVESTGLYGKMLMGGFDDIHLADYTVDCDVLYTSSSMNAGILIRTTNASTGGADDNPVLGTDFLQGYIVLAGTTSVSIGKHNYSWQALATGSKNVALNKVHHLRVVAEGATITVYMDDMETPVVKYTDPAPFLTGRAGFRAHNSKVRFDNFVVTPKEKDPTGILLPETEAVAQPSSGQCLYNINGLPVPGNKVTSHGIYIQMVNGKVRKVKY